MGVHSRHKNKKGEVTTESALLQAATQEFADRGYRGTSIRKIAARAGVHPALIRYYFQSKGQLQRTILEHAMTSLLSLTQAAMSEIRTSHDIRKGLLGVVDGYLCYLETNREFPRIIQRGLLDGDPVFVELAEKHLKPIFDAIQAAALNKERDSDLPHLMFDFFGLAISYFSYAPMIAPLLGSDPLGPAELERRHAHVKRLAEVVIDRILGIASA